MVLLKYKLPCILAAITLVKASNIKGLAPEKQVLYKPSEEGTWTCLDGSKTIPYSAINDDYCDCPDGSDEPGTSACPNGYFYCQNVGHIPSYIKSSSVNDGVCDEACCDGSDENGDLITCPNRCKVVGEAYQKEQTSLKESVQAGLTAKKILIEEAQNQIRLWEEEQVKLEDELVLKKSALLRLQHIATLKNDVVILKREIHVLMDILKDMKRDHDHNFHDMAVKSAIKGLDDFVSRFTKVETEIDEDLKHIKDTSEEEEGVEEEEEEKEEEESQSSTEKNLQNDQGKHSVFDVILEKLESVLPTALKNGVLDKLVSDNKDTVVVDHKTALEKTREQIRTIEDEINQLDSDLNKITDNLAFDYGQDKEWLKLKDVCIEKDEGEYTYSLCFLGDAYQKSNKDSTRTHLGKFEKFGEKEGVDRFKTHIHTHGTRCWNGPERSVKATVECGVKNEIVEVSEPEKCEYHYRLLSPAVCQSIAEIERDQNTSHKPIHEEL
ncbi:glucosidase II beta subunit-like-domain-containing protein [Cokeromyces recurvatus]|uniref:glucosidase II beta subunit-like-domain-containing protein n=1 Tax=Cokeromyces recurvatus TaxID=90255 RepID=UPI002220F6D8|nr:glucosidase II beta subunit-like-domain-containing protein [Cokeromyces recurvatus]KAI7903569.1 glucosidase II beta subunit-like-domain-containing protein [Cokeromyces recurvatus]